MISRHDSVTEGEISGSYAIQTGTLHLYRDSIDFNGNLKALFRQNPSELNASVNSTEPGLKKRRL